MKQVRLIFKLSVILLLFTLRADAGMLLMGGGTPAVASFTYTSTQFAGDRLYHTGNLTGIADSKQLLMSIWFKLTSAGDNGSLRQLLNAYDGGTNRRVELMITAGDILRIVIRNAASTIIIDETNATGTFTSATGWVHVMASYDLAASKYHLYINGTSNQNNAVLSDDTIDYNMAGGGAQWDIIGVEDNSRESSILLSEYYFTNTYLDLSISGNRDKFRSGTGHPVDLGADGSTPTGTQPLIYFHNAYGTFGTNLGSGGNFSVNGALADGGADIP
jgi:hypothetical protein